MKIEIGFGDRESHFVHPVYRALQAIQGKYGFDLSLTTALPSFAVGIDSEIIGYIAHSDYYPIGPVVKERLAAIDDKVKIIFKYQFTPKWNYGREIKNPERVISAGYFFPDFGKYEYSHREKEYLLSVKRPIDVVASMTLTRNAENYSKTLPVIPLEAWSEPRKLIHRQAQRMGTQGYKILTKYLPRHEFLDSLFSSNIGFNWSGCGYLTFRIIEYIFAGVVMITNPLGEEHPIREDVILEDGVHCIFCLDPGQYQEMAEQLLADQKKVSEIRKNIIELWENKLCPKAVGEWYYQKLTNLR